MMQDTTEVQVVPVEQEIELALTKVNITSAIISKLKEDYLPLKVTDKKSFKEVDEARKVCKEIRVKARKLCEEGREKAVQIQKKWVAKQKEVTEEIEQVENYLEGEVNQWKAKEKEEEERAELARKQKERELNERLMLRQQDLNKMGVNLSGGLFFFKDVSFPSDTVRDSDEDIYQETIFSAFKAAYDLDEAERQEQERLRQEEQEKQQQETLRLQQEKEELERKQREFEEKQAAFEKQQKEAAEAERRRKDEEERKEQERIAEEQRQQKEKIEGLIQYRFSELNEVHWSDAGKRVMYMDSTIAFREELASMSGDEFTSLRNEHNTQVASDKAEAERKRQEEEEKQRIEAEKKALERVRLDLLTAVGINGTLSSRDFKNMDEIEWGQFYSAAKEQYEEKKKQEWLEQERIKKEQEELREKERLADLSEGERWREWKKSVTEFILEVPAFETKRYKTMSAIAKEKLEEILSLKAEKFSGK